MAFSVAEEGVTSTRVGTGVGGGVGGGADGSGAVGLSVPQAAMAARQRHVIRIAAIRDSTCGWLGKVELPAVQVYSLGISEQILHIAFE